MGIRAILRMDPPPPPGWENKLPPPPPPPPPPPWIDLTFSINAFTGVDCCWFPEQTTEQQLTDNQNALHLKSYHITLLLPC